MFYFYGSVQLERHENKRRGTTNGTGRKKSYGCDLEKEEKLDWSYTQRRKPSEGGDRGSDDRKKTKGKETIGYAERVPERIVVCGTKEKGRKQERVENMEAKNLPYGRTLTTTMAHRPSTSFMSVLYNLAKWLFLYSVYFSSLFFSFFLYLIFFLWPTGFFLEAIFTTEGRTEVKTSASRKDYRVLHNMH